MIAIVYQLLLVNGVDYLLWPVDSIICLHYVAVGSAFATTELVFRSDGGGRILTKDCGRGAGYVTCTSSYVKRRSSFEDGMP